MILIIWLKTNNNDDVARFKYHIKLKENILWTTIHKNVTDKIRYLKTVINRKCNIINYEPVTQRLTLINCNESGNIYSSTTNQFSSNDNDKLK